MSQHRLSPGRKRIFVIFCAAVVAVVILIGLALAYGASNRTNADRTDAGVPVVPVSAPAAATPTPTPAATTVTDGSLAGDGEWLVGTGIPPGTYRTAGPAEGQNFCQYARLRDSDDRPYIDSNIGKGPLVVTIRATDHTFRTRGCQPWVPVPANR